VCLLSSDADLGGVRVLPQFRSYDGEYKGNEVYHC